MSEKSICYTVYCSTGCTCCRDENHDRGPFETKVHAERAVAIYAERKLLASQYARSGRYSISETSCEKLPDGRLILGGSFVVQGFVKEGEEMSDEAILPSGY